MKLTVFGGHGRHDLGVDVLERVNDKFVAEVILDRELHLVMMIHLEEAEMDVSLRL